MKFCLRIFLVVTLVVTMVSAEVTFTKEHKELLDKLAEMFAGKKVTPNMKLAAPVRREISDVERSEKINRGFERAIQFVNVLGQVDNFISDRARNFVKTLNAVYELDDKEKVRRSRSKGFNRE